jgi:hypothetical protein
MVVVVRELIERTKFAMSVRLVQGWFNYHAVPTNFRLLSAFRFNVVDLWRRSLRRRSQKDVTTWERIESLAREGIVTGTCFYLLLLTHERKPDTVIPIA